MSRISLPKCHLLRATDLLQAIVQEVSPDFEAANVELEPQIQPNMLCEADQDQFVDTIIYVIDLTRERAKMVQENPKVWIKAFEEDGWINIGVMNNSLTLDPKAADAASQSPAVDLVLEFDSNVGNCLTLSFPVSTPLDSRPRTEKDEAVELAR